MQRKDILITALKAAGEEMLKHDPAQTETSVKSTAGDLVTAADLASEKIIVDTIKAAFPEDLVISEETEESHGKLNDNDLPQLTGWVVDPIDGTYNFKRGMSYSAVSIGYIKNGEPFLGGIFNPYRNELYIAEVNLGATCNGKPIHVSTKHVFDGATRVCAGNGMAPGATQTNLATFAKLGDVWVDVLGSAVLMMSDVASGRLDLYFHNGLKPWDNAAVFLIAQEAGAKIVGLKGQPVTWLTSDVVLGNPELVDLFIQKTVS